MSERAVLLNAQFVPRLGELVGPECVVTDAAALAAYEVDERRPVAALLPGSPAEVAEIVHFAVTERLAVIPMGGRTKLGIGMPPRRYDLALDTSRMNRVLAYDPRDLTLGVEPGVRFADLDRQLATESQFLPLAPAFADRATLGGMVAANADTPLRHGFGGMRDHVLGMEFVTGAGVTAKSGGRVVKNVSGYDIHKLLIGSLGTLAVITRVNFRTFPRAPVQETFVASVADAAAALELCRAIAKSQLQPRVVEAMNPAAARLVAPGGAAGLGDAWSVVVVAAGQQAAVERHGRQFEALARAARATEFHAVGDPEQSALLDRICDFARWTREASPGAAILRIAALPSVMPALLQQSSAVGERHAFDHAILVRAAGMVYAALLPHGGEARAAERLSGACRDLVRAAVEVGAQPMIEWCPPEVKREVNVWPPPGKEQPLAERLKKVFDPHGILAPGRFRGGI